MREILQGGRVLGVVGKPGSGRFTTLEVAAAPGSPIFDLERWTVEHQGTSDWSELSAYVLGLAENQRPIVVANASAQLGPDTIRRLVGLAREGRIRIAVLAVGHQDLPPEIADAERIDVAPLDRPRAFAMLDHRFGMLPFGPTLDHLLARTNSTYRIFRDLVESMAGGDAFQERNGYLVARRIKLDEIARDLHFRYSWWRPGQDAPEGAGDLVDLMAITAGADSIDVMEAFGLQVVRYLLRRGTLRMSKSERRVLPSSTLHGQILVTRMSLSRKFELYSQYAHKLRRSCEDPVTALAMWQWMKRLGRQPARRIAAIAANRATATGAEFQDPTVDNAAWRIANVFRTAEVRGHESALRACGEMSGGSLNSPKYLGIVLNSGDYLGLASSMESDGDLPPDFAGHQSVIEALELFRKGSINEVRTKVRTLNLKRMSFRPLLLTALMRLQLARICMDNRLADQAVKLIGSAVGWDRATNSVAYFAAALNDIEQGRVNSAAVGASIFLDSIKSDTRHLFREPAEAIRAAGSGRSTEAFGSAGVPATPAAVELAVGTHRLRGLLTLGLEMDELAVGRAIRKQLQATSPERDPYLYTDLALSAIAAGVDVSLEAAQQALSMVDVVGLAAVWRRVLAAYGAGQVGPIVEAADELNTSGLCLESQRMARIARSLARRHAETNLSERQQRSLNSLSAPAWRQPGRGLGSRRLLTGRETEVVEMIQAGLADAKIAAQLGLSVRTVHAHVRNILSKLGASNRREAVQIWTRVRQ